MLPSADQAAIVIDGAPVTSTATEVPGKNCRVAPIFASTRKIISFSRSSTDFWSADDMAIILLMSATTSEQWKE